MDIKTLKLWFDIRELLKEVRGIETCALKNSNCMEKVTVKY